MRSNLGQLSRLTKPAHIPDAQPEIFQGRGGFVKLEHHDKNSSKIAVKNAPQEKILKFFLLDPLKTTF